MIGIINLLSSSLYSLDVWCEHRGSFLYSYANYPRVKYVDLEDAKKACIDNDKCNGITQVIDIENNYENYFKGEDLSESCNGGNFRGPTKSCS